MGVPKQRHTKSRRNKRRMHIFAKEPGLTKCPKCGKPVLPHRVCQNCGNYKGEQVLDVLKKLTKKERKKKEKEMKAKETAEKNGAEEKPLSWQELSRK